jgi:hypothetical protein
MTMGSVEISSSEDEDDVSSGVGERVCFLERVVTSGIARWSADDRFQIQGVTKCEYRIGWQRKANSSLIDLESAKLGEL